MLSSDHVGRDESLVQENGGQSWSVGDGRWSVQQTRGFQLLISHRMVLYERKAAVCVDGDAAGVEFYLTFGYVTPCSNSESSIVVIIIKIQ